MTTKVWPFENSLRFRLSAAVHINWIGVLAFFSTSLSTIISSLSASLSLSHIEQEMLSYNAIDRSKKQTEGVGVARSGHTYPLSLHLPAMDMTIIH